VESGKEILSKAVTKAGILSSHKIFWLLKLAFLAILLIFIFNLTLQAQINFRSLTIDEGKTILNTTNNWLSPEGLDTGYFASEFDLHQFTISNNGTPVINSINLEPELDVTYFGNYHIRADILEPVGTITNSVKAIVTPINGEMGQTYTQFYTDGTPYGAENKTFTLVSNPISGKYEYDTLRPDDIYPQIFFAHSSYAYYNEPVNIILSNTNYHLLHFNNPFTLGDNSSFFIEFNTVPVSLSGPPSVDMQVYLVSKGKTETFFNNEWLNNASVELVGVINRFDAYSHAHTGYSQHHIIRLSTNADGTIGNKHLDISDDFWVVLYAPTHLETRAWNLRYHSACDNKGTWFSGSLSGYTVTPQSGCPDVHIHVARNSGEIIDGVNVEVVANYNSDLEVSGDASFYFGPLPNLPPNASAFISPVPGVYKGEVRIEWYPATDPNNDVLTYNVILVDNISKETVYTIATGITATYYQFNTFLIGDGSYDILIEADDGVFETGFYVMQNFDAAEEFIICNGNGCIEITGSKGWRMISTPRGTNYFDFLGSFITQGIPNSSYPLKQPNFLWFDETDTLTTNMGWRSVNSLTDNIQPGRGYYFYIW